MATNRGIGSRAFVPYGTAGFAGANNEVPLPMQEPARQTSGFFDNLNLFTGGTPGNPYQPVADGLHPPGTTPNQLGPTVEAPGRFENYGPSATGADQITPLAPRPLINRIGSSVGNGLLRSLTMGIAGRNNPNPIIGYAPNGEPVYQGRLADGHSRAADIYRNVMNSLQNYANNHANLGAPTAEGRGPGAGGGTGGWGFGSQNNPGGFGNFGFAAGGGGAITHFLMNAPLRKH